MADLQQTFVDTIELARYLDIGYVWIDSMCIIRDSSADWANEALSMCDVYANAYCTIAATGFSDGKNGLFVKREPDLVNPVRFTTPPDSRPGYGVPYGTYYCVNDIWKDGITEAPLAQRAWCFQERCLSRRMVHFGPGKVFWECMDADKCDIFPSGVPTTFKTNYKQKNAFTKIDLKLRSGWRMAAWADTVSAYSSGVLTYERDKLAASAGLASKQIWSRPYRYWAGLWDIGIHWALLWEITREGNFVGASKRPSTFRAPSWSWASVDGPVSFLDKQGITVPLLWIKEISVTTTSGQKFTETDNSTQEYHNRLDTFNASPSTSTLNPLMFSPLSSAYMRVHGLLACVSFIESDNVLAIPHRRRGPYPMIIHSRDPHNDLSFNLLVFLDVYAPPQWSFAPSIQNSSDRMSLGRRDFFILAVTQGMYLPAHSPNIDTPVPFLLGLILQRTETGNEGEYHRLGVFITTSEDRNAGVLEFLTRSVFRPAFEESDYEMYDESDGRCSITLV